MMIHFLLVVLETAFSHFLRETKVIDFLRESAYNRGQDKLIPVFAKNADLKLIFVRKNVKTTFFPL